jgi:hypothetical protein
MPLFYLSRWSGPTKFCIQNKDGDDILSIERDDFGHDDFVIRDAIEGDAVAEIHETTTIFGPFTYDIVSSKSERTCATLTHMHACCTESFELAVYDAYDGQTRKYYFDATSVFSRDYALTRNGHVVATYANKWWAPGEISIKDEYVKGDKVMTAIILYSCVILERIQRRKAQQNAQLV